VDNSHSIKSKGVDEFVVVSLITRGDLEGGVYAYTSQRAEGAVP
jgi:hypothetical protein